MDNFLVNIENFIRAYSFLGIPLSFLGGALVAFSPCTLPLLPVTISIIGEAAIRFNYRTFILSIIFVLGVTLTYVVFGVLAALMGIFIERLINPYILYLLLGGFFVLLGLSFFDVFHISVFNVGYPLKRNLASLFLLGIVTGFSMLPCAFPVLGSILGIISFKKDVFYGVFCLFSFSLGYAVVLIIVGSWGAVFKRLSKNRVWFIIIRKTLGVIVLGAGVYFIVCTLKLLL